MSTIDERAEMIRSSIIAQAERERGELIAKANEIRESEIKAFKDRLVQDMFGNIQRKTSNLRADSVKAVSGAQLESRQSLLRRREELAAIVFASVRARLLDYAKTPEYAAALRTEVASVAGDYDHGMSTLRLREADMPLAEELSALLPGCKAEADSSIHIGGWKLLNTASGILIDETLDTRLLDSRPWFLLNSGLRLDAIS